MFVLSSPYANTAPGWQHSPGSIVSFDRDNIPIHETHHILASSRSRYVLPQPNRNYSHILILISLGLAFNWGALLGWSAVAQNVNWTVALPLYAGGICWTLVYDSIYAHQDKFDDITVGIRSTALLFGSSTRPILTSLSATSLSSIALAGFLNAQGLPFYTGVGLAAIQLSRILYRTDFDDRASCWKGFVGCGWVGFWIWMGATADYVVQLLEISL